MASTAGQCAMQDRDVELVPHLRPKIVNLFTDSNFAAIIVSWMADGIVRNA